MTPPPLGTLLARLRHDRGWSQQRLAAELCAAAGVSTLTRHEISRWERQLRLPGDFWLGWLAVVLAVPAGLLTDAAARDHHRAAAPGPATGSRPRAALIAVAHRWAADPRDGLLAAPTAAPLAGLPVGGTPDRVGPLAELRRLDDLVGGADLAPAGAYRLGRVVRRLAGAGPVDRRRLLPTLAESAQLCGWLAADAGDAAGALGAYRLGLRAAAAAGDPALGGHVLASASHLLAGVGDPQGALLLARLGYAGARRAASPGLRALLLHRVALAAALGGRHRAAGAALAAAGRATGAPEPGREPPWLYWLDGAELAAMTGRTLVALGRPGPAEPPLRAAAHRAGRPRSAAVYGAWLARAHLQAGEVEQACAVAGAALLDAVRAGSPRAVGQLTEVRRRLAEHPDHPAVRRYGALVAAVRPWLPRGGPTGRPGPRRPRVGPSRPTRRPGG